MYQDRSRFPTPPRQLYPSRAEMLDKGKVERRNAMYSTLRIPAPQDRHLSAAYAPLQSAAQVREQVKIEERKG